MIQICTDNSIKIDGESTGLYLGQRREGSFVYSAGHGGANYKEHPMPHPRYSASHDAPASGAAGRAQLENDIRALFTSLK